MSKNMKDLVDALAASLSCSDVIAAEALAKVSTMIFKARIDRGMTQKEFAELLGVSQGMVSKWESEDYNFSIEALAKICEKLDWDLMIDMRPRSKTRFSQINNSFRKWRTKESVVSRNYQLEVAS